MEQNIDVSMSQIPKGRRVAWDALSDPITTRAGRAIWSYTDTAFPNPKAQTVTAGMVVVMTCSAANVQIAREDLVIE